MGLVFSLAAFIAIAAALYMMWSSRGKSLTTNLKCLIFSTLVFCAAALWCVVYGPDKWVLIQAGVIIIIATLAGLLSLPKA